MTRAKNGSESATFHFHAEEIGWAGLLQLIERQAARSATDEARPMLDLVAEVRDLLQAWGVFEADRPIDVDQSGVLSTDEIDGAFSLFTPSSSDPAGQPASGIQADVGEAPENRGMFQMPAPLTNESGAALDSPVSFDPAALTETEFDDLLARMQNALPELLDKVKEAVIQAFPDHAFFPGGLPGEAIASLLQQAGSELATPAPLPPPTDFIG